jgi:PAS domain S-box-containing protein
MREVNGAISENLFTGGGEMGALMRSHNWSQTPLGAVETWPQSLRSALSICLNSRFPIAIYWGQDCILLYNDAWRPIVGDKHSWALGHPAREVWSEIWDDIGPELAGVLATGEGTFHKDDLLAMHRFGYTEECFFEYTFNPIQGQGGSIDGVFNIVSETTYRVLNDRRAQLLRELASKTGIAKTAEASCELILEAFKSNPFDLPLALLYLVDADGKQARLCKSSEFTPDNLVSPAVIDLVAEDDSNGWPIALAARTAQPQVVTNLVSRFGVLPGSPWTEPPQEAVVLPIAAPGHGKVSGVLVAVANPRRRLDNYYRDFFTQIAGQIALVIANAQAYEEERERAEALAELDRAKTAFFSNVSHEFRTPLTLMLSPLENLSSTLDGRLQPDEREQLQLVQRNGLRLQKLVNTLLDFSRIEAGRVQASYEPTDLATYTAELASSFRSLIEQAGMALVIDCPALPTVYVDREMWEKIILNLLSNAFKFTFAGSITVRLRSVGDAVELAVADTGVGIPEAELAQLFERFHRVSGTRARTYEGSGIGLALVQELVKLHGGTLQVTSQVDWGTTFTISIPFGTAHLPQDRIQSTRTLESTALGAATFVEEALRWLPDSSEVRQIQDTVGFDAAFPPVLENGMGGRILLADDNADMRDYVKRLLSSRFEVEAVANGVAALNAIQTHPPDLVLTDVMMPEMDGFELLRSLRNSLEGSPLRENGAMLDIPIILLSARAGEEARIEALEAGADDYLIKPFSARELLARVEATLKLAQLRRTAREREQALQLESETNRAVLDQILSSLRDGFVTFDRDWRYTYVNDRQLEILKLPREAVMGRNLWEVFPDDVGTEAYYQLHRAMNEKITVQFEFYYPILKRWVEHRVYPTMNGIAMLAADITERKRSEAKRQQAEMALREAHVQLEAALAAGAVYTWRWNISTDRIVVNAAFAHLFAVDPVIATTEGLPIELFLNAMHEEDRPRISAAIQQAIETGEEYKAEYRVHTAAGEERWLTARGRVEYDTVGNPVSFPGALIDITEAKREEAVRKQAEQALRESEDRLQLAIASTQLGTWDWNLVTGELKWDVGCKTMFGLPPDAESSIEIFFEGLHPEDRDRLQNVMQMSLDSTSGGVYDTEYRTIGIQDHVERWIKAKGQAYFDATGKPLRFVGTVLDITAQKQVTAQREQLLQQEQAARETAERANRVKDEFLAVLSHELRSPLNPILGWARLLQNGKLDPARQTEALKTIERNAKLQSQLIEDLLDISRIMQGKLSFTAAPVNLIFVISAAIETVRLAAEAKQIQILLDLDPAIASVSGDAGRLQQVVWNLLTNAVKFTPSGGQVTVELRQMDQLAQIRVIDTGKGINLQFLPHVFEYFRQEDGSTTRKFGGLGLGLAIVRQIVELHGGTVQAESPGEGLGAIFTVTLPLMPIQPTLNLDQVSSQSSLSLTGVKTLVIDDETDSREFVAFVLEQAGATVITAPTAGEGFLALTQAQPDVLLSDIGMPDMDGYMLMQQVRALPPEQGGQVKAIALTAYAGEYDQRQALQAGFQQHLAKPIEPERLIEVIVSLLESHP